MRWIRTGGSIAVFLVAAGMHASAHACCPASARGARVAIADQEILVVWDEARHQEHFIRRAAFQAGSARRDFGFLVPTPTKPALAKAPDGAFDALAAATKPEPKLEYDVSFMPLVFLPFLSLRSTK